MSTMDYSYAVYDSNFTNLDTLVTYCKASLSNSAYMFDGTSAVTLGDGNSNFSGSVTVTFATEPSLAGQAALSNVLASYVESTATLAQLDSKLRWVPQIFPTTRVVSNDTSTFTTILTWQEPNTSTSKLRRLYVGSFCTPNGTSHSGSDDCTYEMRIVDMCKPYVLGAGAYSNETRAFNALDVSEQELAYDSESVRLDRQQQELQVRTGPDCKYIDISSVVLGFQDM